MKITCKDLLAGAVVAMCTMLAGCGVEFLDDDSQTGDAAIPSAVQGAFNRSCAYGGCHASASLAGGLALDQGSSPAILSARSSTGERMVVLGDVNASYLALKMMAPDLPAGVTISGGPMPPSQNQQVRNDIATILAWIDGTDSTATTTDTATTDTTADGSCITSAKTAGDASISYAQDVEPIFLARCSGAVCHADGGVLPPMLDKGLGYSSLVGQPVKTGADGNYISAGDAELSYAWRKITNSHLEVRGGSGAVMPVGKALCGDELTTVYRWIVSGAKP